MPKPYPLEFRRDVVAVASKHGAPLGQIAKDFGISESCLACWLKKADVEDGVKPGVTEKESAELRDSQPAPTGPGPSGPPPRRHHGTLSDMPLP
jgi:transposase